MISSKNIRFQLLLSTAVAASLALPSEAGAQNLPVAPAPDPTITTTGNVMTVNLQNNARKVYNWNSFDIANGSEVEFTGTLNTGQAVLNRVTLNNPSDIDGILSSFSWIQVFLINPNGIIFGPNAQVNTGSFIASALGLDDNDILGTDGTPGS